MCEPHFSFIQLFHGADQRNSNQVLFGTEIANSDLASAEINQYLHYCSLGDGHTGANGKLNLQGGHRDNRKNDYECEWWIRNVNLDGHFYHPDIPKNSLLFNFYLDQRPSNNLIECFQQESLEAAIKYSRRVAIGNLPQVRHFLETSIRKSSRTYGYFESFYYMLNAKGREEFTARSKRVLGKSTIGQTFAQSMSSHILRNGRYEKITNSNNPKLEPMIKMVMGLTRKRELLVPEWADDDVLWAKN